MKNLLQTTFLLIAIPHFLVAQFPKLDESFSVDGSFNYNDFHPIDMAVSSNGSVFALGTSSEGLKVISTDKDGSLNEAFGNSGEFLFPFQALSYLNTNIYIQPDQKILIGATVEDPDIIEGIQYLIVLLRLNQDGTIDTDFGDNGIVYLNNSNSEGMGFEGDIPGSNLFRDLLFVENNLLVAGSSSIPFPLEFEMRPPISVISLFKMHMDGLLDESFGDNGKKLILKRSTYEGAPEYDYDGISPTRLKLQSNGNIIILAGYASEAAEGPLLALIRIFPDGMVDDSFNEGNFPISIKAPYEGGNDMINLENDEIIISAFHIEESDLSGARSETIVARFNKEGIKDLSFNNNQGLIHGLPRGPGKLLPVKEGFLILVNNSIIKRQYNGTRATNFGNRGWIWDIPTITTFELQEKKLLIGKFNQSTNIGTISRYFLEEETTIPPDQHLITKLTLINASTNQELFEIEDGQVINLQEIGTNEINIRAYTDPEPTGSVRFVLSGAHIRTHVENVSYYALFANDGDNFFSWQPPLGDYQLTATPYTESGAQGEAGTALTVSFSIIDEEVAPVKVERLTLINASTNQELFEIEDGQVINLQEIGTNEINIRAYTDPEPTGSVRFVLTGPHNRTHIENVSYYALFANDGDNFFSWQPPLGHYNLNVTPFTEIRARGEEGTSMAISFSIVDESPEVQRMADVFPNPGTSTLFIPLENQNTVKVLMFDLAGKQVMDKVSLNHYDDRMEINVNGLESKAYIIQLVSDKETRNIRWMKE